MNIEHDTHGCVEGEGSINLPTLTCLRCGHTWVPRQAKVVVCAKCKSPYWDRPRRGASPKSLEMMQAMVKRDKEVKDGN